MSDFQLRGSVVWGDISHPPALLPLLQHSKQTQPTTWGPESPFHHVFQAPFSVLSAGT